MKHQISTPNIALCTTYDAHDPILLDGVMPYVEFLEFSPGSISRLAQGQIKLHPQIVQSLQEKAGQVQYLAHGVGLSIGSAAGYQEAYLDLLDQVSEVLPLKWHSEHLGYTTVDGEQLNTMLALPRTRAMLDVLIPRIRAIQERYPYPFLLENIVHLLPDYPPEFSDAEFLNILHQETGCALILDLYNLECDAFNYGFDVQGFLKELHLKAVKEIHLAGGTQHKGFQLDIHSGIVAESTLDLTKRVLDKDQQIEVITYEILPQAVQQHGQQLVIDELARLSHIFNISKNEHQQFSTTHQVFN